ncbi:RICIN domain-containing protein [Streptomyces lacrimifluminis]|nr:RICIN domain-containing protein [Streptomyces lacrimifluminis]
MSATAPSANDDSAVCVEVSGMSAVLAGGVYRLVCVRSGKALDDSGGTSDGAAMVQRTANAGTQQQWAITALGGGAYRLTNRHSGKVLDNANVDTEGSTVIQWSANGGSPQQWKMTKIG